MTAEYIDNFFPDNLMDIEDKFLGIEITPDKVVERVFYDSEGSYDPIKDENIFKYHETARISEKSSKEPYEFFEYNGINYEELSLDWWNNFFYGYWVQDNLTIIRDDFFSKLDKFVSEPTNKYERISFVVGYLNDKIKDGIFELEKLLKNSKEKKEGFGGIGKKELNEHQEILASTHLKVYKAYESSLQQGRYEILLPKKQNTPEIDRDEKSLKKNLYSGAVSTFIEHENRIIEEGLIDSKLRFNDKHGNIKKLIMFCLVLADRNYIRKHPDPERTKRNAVKFFKKRYGAELGDSGKYSKYKNYKTNGEFHFIKKCP